MAITKVMHMKASSKARIDIHLEHSINYILQPKKLGEANLVGGINCLPDTAFEQMLETKKLYHKIRYTLTLLDYDGTTSIPRALYIYDSTTGKHINVAATLKAIAGDKIVYKEG